MSSVRGQQKTQVEDPSPNWIALSSFQQFSSTMISPFSASCPVLSCPILQVLIKCFPCACEGCCAESCWEGEVTRQACPHGLDCGLFWCPSTRGPSHSEQRSKCWLRPTSQLMPIQNERVRALTVPLYPGMAGHWE